MNSALRYAMPDVLVVARHPGIVAAAEAASLLVTGRAPVLCGSAEQAIAALSRPGLPPRRIVLEAALPGAAWPALLAALDDPRMTSALLVVGRRCPLLPAELPVLPPDAETLACALRAVARVTTGPCPSVKMLARGMVRGGLMVRYQPIVCLRTRRPVMVEALARWRGGPMHHGAESFVPLAERAGLAGQLAAAVVALAAREVPALAGRSLPVAVNLPLQQLLQPGLPAALARGRRPAGGLTLELTETTQVRDRAALARAIRRARAAGHGVALDDLAPRDGRLAQLRLPFSDVKLDRSVVAAAPGSAAARRFIVQVVRCAEASGQRVTAEGVASAVIWRAMAGLGVHRAQGFWVGRPLPGGALGPWARQWAAAARL